MHEQFFFKKQWKLFKEQSDTMLGKPKTVGDKVWNAYQVAAPVFDGIKHTAKAWGQNYDAEGNKLPSPLNLEKLDDIEKTWNHLNTFLHNNTNPNMTKVYILRDGIIKMMSDYARELQSKLGKDRQIDNAINSLIKSLKPTFASLNF